MPHVDIHFLSASKRSKPANPKPTNVCLWVSGPAYHHFRPAYQHYLRKIIIINSKLSMSKRSMWWYAGSVTQRQTLVGFGLAGFDRFEADKKCISTWGILSRRSRISITCRISLLTQRYIYKWEGQFRELYRGTDAETASAVRYASWQAMN